MNTGGNMERGGGCRGGVVGESRGGGQGEGAGAHG